MQRSFMSALGVVFAVLLAQLPLLQARGYKETQELGCFRREGDRPGMIGIRRILKNQKGFGKSAGDCTDICDGQGKTLAGMDFGANSHHCFCGWWKDYSARVGEWHDVDRSNCEVRDADWDEDDILLWGLVPQ